METNGRATGLMYGPVVKEPETKILSGNKELVKILIRVDNGYQSRDAGWQPRLEMIPVTFFGLDAEKVNKAKLNPGDVIAVNFKVSGREYQEKYYAEIVGREFNIISRATGYSRSEPPDGKVPDLPDDPEDDLPF